MAIVEISNWQPGFQKVSCTKLLKASAGLDLADAKRITDGVLAGELQLVQVSSLSAAVELVAALQQLGASACVSPSPPV